MRSMQSVHPTIDGDPWPGDPWPGDRRPGDRRADAVQPVCRSTLDVVGEDGPVAT